MATVDFIEYADAPPEVRQVYDDIMATRKVDWINNFWKTLAVDPALLSQTWQRVKAVMAPGALYALTKELIYVAVSVTNGCQYCINTHGRRAKQGHERSHALGADGGHWYGQPDQCPGQRLPDRGRWPV